MYPRKYRRKWKHHGGDSYYFEREERQLLGPLSIVLFALGITALAVFFLVRARPVKPLENKPDSVKPAKVPSGYPPMAKIPSAGVTVYLPAEVNKVVTIGYHEAERPTTYSVQPLGYCVGNENEKKMDSAVPAADGELPFFVLNTRGRRASATSAVDIAMLPGAEIKSPVTGEITKIKLYYLYGKYADYHLEIMPQGHPEMRVALIHLDNLRVKVGDRVEHGETALGNIRQFKRYIKSQIDRYTGDSFGHLHLQINPFEEQDDGISGS